VPHDRDGGLVNLHPVSVSVSCIQYRQLNYPILMILSNYFFNFYVSIKSYHYFLANTKFQ
jgi:hypothetical protein